MMHSPVDLLILWKDQDEQATMLKKIYVFLWQHDLGL